ncbi:MAG TPA: hypothetical protein VHI97_00855 [Actinomycetota bacterium]|nr:hypothetical protein [Actinomycetota bacterium]
MNRHFPILRRAMVVGVASTVTLQVPASTSGQAANDRLLRPYKGLGAWVDVYDPKVWRHAADAVRQMDAHGVQTLFLETSSWRIRDAIYRPKTVNVFITEAHRRGMQVVAWYVPDFRDLKRDFRRSMAAIKFRTPNGQKFDSFALDIESFEVRDVAKRSSRLLDLSARIRKAVGRSYPLGAIVISPVATRRVPSGWPGFPYRALASYYDVFLPMGYYSYRTDGATAAFNYTRDTLQLLRKDARNRRLPIHAIGGEAAYTDGPEAKAFVDAVKRFDAIGASLYDFDTSGPEDWAHIEKVRVRRSPQARSRQPMQITPAQVRVVPRFFLRILVVYTLTDVVLWTIPPSGARK